MALTREEVQNKLSGLELSEGQLVKVMLAPDPLNSYSNRKHNRKPEIIRGKVIQVTENGIFIKKSDALPPVMVTLSHLARGAEIKTKRLNEGWRYDEAV